MVHHPTAHDTLDHLVGDPNAFVVSYWGQALLIRRGAWPEAATNLVRLSDILKTLTGSALRPPHIRLVKDGRPVPAERFTRETRIAHGTITDAVDPDRVLSEFREGATVMLDAFEDHSHTVQAACRSLSRSLRCPVDSYVFITPPGEKGLELHYDIKEVFVVQLVGTKRWKVYPQVTPVPDDSKVFPDTDLGEPQIDTILQPCDVMYIPKGTPHIAAAPEILSIHISFAARPATWTALLQKLLAQALDAPAFTAVPNLLATKPETLRAQLSAKLDELNQAVRNDTNIAFESGTTAVPALVSALESLTALASPDAELQIHRRQPLQIRRNQAGKTLVRTTGATLAVPEVARPALDALSEHDTIALSELTHHLERPKSLALLGHLVGYGAVAVTIEGDHQ
jgi:ribosomal protein L16 Arg81 hydroxylase